uniref:Uncharacterized protein n=1 Tax=Anguilla anguilla TaxID=7936 RepID=A0A0E9VKQ3_ANGAN
MFVFSSFSGRDD